MKRFVFVYGTLKAKEGASSKLDSADYIGTYISKERFRVFGRSFPYAFLSTDGDPLRGEVYHCDEKTFKELDEYEGFPDHYTRHQMRFFREDIPEIEVTAWMYHIQEPQGEYWQPLVPGPDGILEWTRLKT